MKTTNLTFFYCLPAFLVPYLYVYANELLLIGSFVSIIITILSSFVGISCMAVTFHGYLFRSLNWVERILFLIGGLSNWCTPNWVADVIGYVLIGILVFLQVGKGKKRGVFVIKAN